MIAGIVAISAGAKFYYPIFAFHVGILGGLFYALASALTHKFKVDDPLEIFEVHCLPGFLSLFLVPFFHRDHGLVFMKLY